MSSSSRSPTKPPTDHPTSSLRHTLTEGFESMDSPKGHAGHLNSVHDLVLDYLHHNAYAGTAKILSQPRPRHSSTSAAPSSSTLPIPTEKDATTDAQSGISDERMEVDGNPDPSPAGGSNDAAKKRKAKERLLSTDELNSVERRRVIINYILNGAILRAVEHINTYFPDVLDESKPHKEDSEYPTHENTTPLPYSNEHLPSPSTSTAIGAGAGPTFAQPPKSLFVGYSVEHESPVFCQSHQPSHVKLNLQIQQFIESFRNLAPSSPSSPSSSISSLTSSMHMSVTLPANGNSLNGSGPASNGANGNTNGVLNGSNGLGNGSSSSGVTLTNALTAAQGLHAEAKKLPAHIRAVYLQEIKDVGALFAYTEPEKSILSGFLEQTRRIYLAEQVNAAILVSEGRPGPSFLYNIAQRTQAIYSVCRERRIDVLPPDLDEKGRADDITTAYWRYQQQAVNKTQSWFRLKYYVRDNWA